MHPLLNELEPDTLENKERLRRYVERYFDISLTLPESTALFAAIWGDAPLFASVAPSCDLSFKDNIVLQAATLFGHADVLDIYLSHLPNTPISEDMLRLTIRKGHLEAFKTLYPHRPQKTEGVSFFEYAIEQNALEHVRFMTENHDTLSLHFSTFWTVITDNNIEMASLIKPYAERDSTNFLLDLYLNDEEKAFLATVDGYRAQKEQQEINASTPSANKKHQPFRF
jgi:hypothetical protein